jgi:hypothetical protein
VETPSGATTETTSTPPGGEGSANPGAESPPAAKGPGEVERINELTENWRETQRDRDYWRNKAINGDASNKPPSNESSTTDGNAADDDDVKTLADFKYDEKAYTRYVRDLSAQAAKREADAVRSEIREGQTKAEREAARADFSERAETWAKGQKLENAELMFASPEKGGPTVTDSMAEAIMTSEQGPEILNYLTRNKVEARRIYRLTPVQQAREIGRLEAKFAVAPTPNKVSGAPPPHEQVKGASDTSVKKDAADMTDQEWWQSKQRSDRAKAAARK